MPDVMASSNMAMAGGEEGTAVALHSIGSD